MATIRQFNIGLYREHLEEASFLYEQRLACLQRLEMPWPALRGLEDRFEAHIDALVVAGDLAIEVCRQAADPGETHAALCVFCREDLKADAFGILNRLDPADEQAITAASLALRFEARAGWRDDMLRLLRSSPSHLTPMLAQVSGFRRYPSEALLAAAAAAVPAGRANIAWALGRVGSADSIPLLSSLLDSDDEGTCEAAAVALLRLGDESVLERARLLARSHPWARRALAIGGDSSAVRVLLHALEDGAAEDTVLALGLLGDLSAVAPLLHLLEDDGLSGSAAVALNTITGANLYADRFVPDTFDPDELFDEERAAYERDGTSPARQDRPYGNWERGPLRDAAGWREWLEQNKQRFSRGHRWRVGEPYGPSALLSCLMSPTTPYAVRSAACDELVARYCLDVPFEVELRVQQQVRFLSKIDTWVQTESSRFEKGRWYFAGRLRG